MGGRQDEERRLNRRVTRSAFYNEKPNVNYLATPSRSGDCGKIATTIIVIVAAFDAMATKRSLDSGSH
jgi:hypothetical protein